jgi:hypothetical protein
LDFVIDSPSPLRLHAVAISGATSSDVYASMTSPFLRS